MKKKRKKLELKLTRSMRTKLFVLFFVLLICLNALILRLMYIQHVDGDAYKKKVLSMQSYDSTVIPYQRGDIVDRNGTILATSKAVYNVILDCSVLTSKEEYIEPTIQALVENFPDLNREELYKYARENKDSRYIILKKQLPYSDIKSFVSLQEAVDKHNRKINPNIKGVWFEKEYVRTYPFGSLASSVIGFTSDGNVGTIGLEKYYDDILNGVNGRKYGYLNADSDFEKTVIAPEDGCKLVTTIDANIQSIVEKKILEFNETYKDNYREGNGSLNTAVIVLDPNNAEILAMAEYPTFDLNHPRDEQAIAGLYANETKEETTEQEEKPEKPEKTEEEIKIELFNKLWKNFCVNETFEPGSVQKAFTIAAGLETAVVSDESSFVCDGYEIINGIRVRCVSRNGHGTETLEKALMDSCNDSMMQISYLLGKDNFVRYQRQFGFGQKTGIDLPGEANTAGLVYTEENMDALSLATNSFGQNYNCTMIQMASAFASLINGGYYYEPHFMNKIVDTNGGTKEIKDKTLLRQTISNGTSEELRKYLRSVVAAGTGRTAKVDGYSMGGKTCTAEKLPRGNGNYLVSFIGFAPAENPEVLIYCVVDEPNSEDQPHSYYAQNIVREILEELFPYMNIYQDEEKTGVNEGLDITGRDPYYTKRNNHADNASTQ